MELLSLPLVAALFATGLVAGFVDSIAGGGGLLTVPVLLWAGLSPAQTLATNKLQSSFGSFSASYQFVASGRVDLRAFAFPIGCTFAGGTLGALAVQRLDPGFLSDALPVLLLLIAGYFLLSPRAGDLDAHQRLGLPAFSVLIGFGIGFYDGFFGPGTGSFFSVAFVALLGYNLTKATAHTKVLNFTSNVSSLLMFLLGGKVVWTLGLVMAAGQFLGARLGSRLVLRSGAKLVRPLLVTMSLAITAKLLWSDEASILRQGWDFLAKALG